MWIGSLKLRVHTEDASNAGADHLLRATDVRDGAELVHLRLDYATENDLERGAQRDYVYLELPRRNDETPELPDGIGQWPAPFPDFGVEFSHGFAGHLQLRLRIAAGDTWIKDKVELWVKRVRRVGVGIDTVFWKEDTTWTCVGSWGQDAAAGTDPSEGHAIWNLAV
jgi:hypothetical protein